ncbi:Motility protein B [Fundidesulfovibrio magnetotacticus]|uniref:Motility protein B n=1 Tax=Fundidesulfovibrio magnetotacticus TaxID=2730080 RepID=A0A6V8LWX2_9BACT|nr:flagellar motor protein MotB [Fundidesulfovibrio magnetotacticus]GFK94157.1 Motility protein B [Fundidesulfovibrio magnetotacticus]
MKPKSAAPRVFRSRRSLPSHHGGSWKVAYADFVTAMMAFFLLMWILNIVPKDVQKAIETYFKADTKLGKVVEDPNSALTGDPDQVRKELTEDQAARFAIAMRFKKIITDDPFLKQSSGVSSDDSGVLLRINNDVMFKPGSAELAPQADKVIKEVREVLKSFNLNLMVRGHSLPGEQAGGPFPSVWELSGARAGAVVRALLQDRAIAPGRVRAVSLGDTLPLTPAFDAASAAQNRRVEFYFHRPDVSFQRVVN